MTCGDRGRDRRGVAEGDHVLVGAWQSAGGGKQRRVVGRRVAAGLCRLEGSDAATACAASSRRAAP